MAHPYRAVYVVARNTKYGRHVRALWNGTLPEGDPFAVLSPFLGEVKAWGEWPHWTVTDALTVTDPEAFERIVQRVCGRHGPPAIRPLRLNIYRTALVVECASEPLAAVRSEIISSTQHLVERVPLADEEFQKAEWWIRYGPERTDAGVKRQVGLLREVRKLYIETDCPPLPACRHFRLGYLVGLYRSWHSSKRKSTIQAKKAERRLRYYLSHGQPAHYASSGGFHTTIVSGLALDPNDKQEKGRLLACYRAELWPIVSSELAIYRPKALAIMAEDERPRKAVTVDFLDDLTQTYVEEKRPGFRVLDSARFGRPSSDPGVI